MQLHHSVVADIKRSSTEGACANGGQSAAAAAGAEAGAAARVCGDPRHPQVCDAPAEDVYRDVHDHSVKEATGILQLKQNEILEKHERQVRFVTIRYL